MPERLPTTGHSKRARHSSVTSEQPRQQAYYAAERDYGESRQEIPGQYRASFESIGPVAGN